jgi:hypothetical protein
LTRFELILSTSKKWCFSKLNYNSIIGKLTLAKQTPLAFGKHLNPNQGQWLPYRGIAILIGFIYLNKKARLCLIAKQEGRSLSRATKGRLVAFSWSIRSFKNRLPTIESVALASEEITIIKYKKINLVLYPPLTGQFDYLTPQLFLICSCYF